MMRCEDTGRQYLFCPCPKHDPAASASAPEPRPRLAGWRYVVAAKTDAAGEDYYEVHEYYQLSDGGRGWSEEAIAPCGETAQDLARDLRLMLYAIDSPEMLDLRCQPPKLRLTIQENHAEN